MPMAVQTPTDPITGKTGCWAVSTVDSIFGTAIRVQAGCSTVEMSPEDALILARRIKAEAMLMLRHRAGRSKEPAQNA
jgi:hypothetical protein